MDATRIRRRQGYGRDTDYKVARLWTRHGLEGGKDVDATRILGFRCGGGAGIRAPGLGRSPGARALYSIGVAGVDRDSRRL